MHVRLAQAADAIIVAGLLSEASAKLREWGKPLSAIAEVSEPVVASHVRDGLYYLGFDGGEVIGVFRFQLADHAFWPEIPEGTSAYLHKFAIAPQKQGLGLSHLLLRHAVRLTREKGRRFLRLDCAVGRPKLCTVYESFGFRHHSQKQIGSHVFDRFELDVGAPDKSSSPDSLAAPFAGLRSSDYRQP